ncbi:MAG: hypothetical protein M1416_00500 [Candidatus Pacearchaeota archaeon]|nr:hypothetical protein [Candidatus Pacearchaeota archaeon]
MLKEMMMLQAFGLSEGVIGELLAKWEALGFFSYLLPFMLIFALVFGILTRTQIFKDNKAVNGIIALAVAFMSLQFDFVPTFFAQIFPRVGVGLAIILAIFIIVGLFVDAKSKVINYILLGIGVLIIGLIILQSAGESGWQSADFWAQYFPAIILGIVILLFIFVVVGSAGKPQEKKDIAYIPAYARD